MHQLRQPFHLYLSPVGVTDAAISAAEVEAAEHLRSAEELGESIRRYQRELDALGAEPTPTAFATAAEWQTAVHQWRAEQLRLRAEHDELERRGRALIDLKLRPAEERLRQLQSQRDLLASQSRSSETILAAAMASTSLRPMLDRRSH